MLQYLKDDNNNQNFTFLKPSPTWEQFVDLVNWTKMGILLWVSRDLRNKSML